MKYDSLTEHQIEIRNRDIYYNENKNRSENNYQGNSNSSLPGIQHFAFYIVNRIWNNKKLRIYFILFVLALISILILILFALMPIILRLFDYLATDGIKGIITGLTEFADKLLNTSVK